jgi:hypothetical protein
LLIALILAKFAIVAVLGLGGAALGHTPLPGVGSLLAGTTLVLLAAFSPWAMLRLLPLHELAGAAVGGLRPHGVGPVQATDGRTHGATDATEDAVDGKATGEGATGADPASEDVATRLPARLRALTRRGAEGGDAPAAAGVGESVPETGEAARETGTGTAGPAATSDGEDAAGGDGVASAGGTGAAGGTEATEVAAVAGAVAGASGAPPASATPTPGEDTSPPLPHPETDAFGPTARDGELPEVLRSIGVDAEPVVIDQPVLDGGGPLPDPGPLPAADPEDDAS